MTTDQALAKIAELRTPAEGAVQCTPAALDAAERLLKANCFVNPRSIRIAHARVNDLFVLWIDGAWEFMAIIRPSGVTRLKIVAPPDESNERHYTELTIPAPD